MLDTPLIERAFLGRRTQAGCRIDWSQTAMRTHYGYYVQPQSACSHRLNAKVNALNLRYFALMVLKNH
jgi:hypothetical protein